MSSHLSCLRKASSSRMGPKSSPQPATLRRCSRACRRVCCSHTHSALNASPVHVLPASESSSRCWLSVGLAPRACTSSSTSPGGRALPVRSSTRRLGACVFSASASDRASAGASLPPESCSTWRRRWRLRGRPRPRAAAWGWGAFSACPRQHRRVRRRELASSRATTSACSRPSSTSSRSVSPWKCALNRSAQASGGASQPSGPPRGSSPTSRSLPRTAALSTACMRAGEAGRLSRSQYAS